MVPWEAFEHFRKVFESLLRFRLVVLLPWVGAVDIEMRSVVTHSADAAVEVLGLVVIPGLNPVLSLPVIEGCVRPDKMD